MEQVLPIRALKLVRNKKTMRAILLFFVLALPALARDYPATVVRAIDGDTIVCNVDLGLGVELKLQHVRLARVNAPERGEPGWKEARDFMVTACVNKVVILHTVGLSEREKYGRILAGVEIGGKDLSGELLRLKLAAPWP
jgi:endonuclease YncB( thermonuclease family)